MLPLPKSIPVGRAPSIQFAEFGAHASSVRQSGQSQSLIQVGRVDRHQADETEPTRDGEVRLEVHEPRSGIARTLISSGLSAGRSEPD